MSTAVDQRKSVRIIAYDAKQVQTLKTVNVSTTSPKDRHQAKECLQLTAAQAAVQHHPTWMASAAVDAKLPTIYINGYTAPN